MSDLPLNLVDPQLGAVLAGRATVLHRPLTARFRGLAPGHRLWIREPFHICSSVGHHAPSVAMNLPGFRLGWAADFASQTEAGLAGLGRRHPARSLPKALHRQHLVLLAVGVCPIDQISLFEIRAQGFPSLAAFRASCETSLAQFGDLYRADRHPGECPPIQRIEFVHVPRPLPKEE